MDDRWAFVAVTDQELSAEKKATTNRVPTEEVMTEDELFDELEKEEPWMEEERTGKTPPARALSKKDMAQGGYISTGQTWSNTELYRLVLAVQPGEGSVSRKIEAITWEGQREDGFISEEQAKMDVVLLCRSHLECDLAAAPDDNTLQFSGLL